MSLTSGASPKLSFSGSYSSSLRQLRLAGESEKKIFSSLTHRSSIPKGPEPDEGSPLVPKQQGQPAEPPQKLNMTLLITILVVTIGSSFQFGYGTGVMNNSQDIIMEYFHNQGKEYTVVQWGTTVSCYGIGGLIGSLLGPKVIGAYVGRRATLLINNIFLVISSALISFAPEWWYQAIGRVFVGIVAGIATAVVPTYFSEISPIAIRGAVG